MTKLDKELFETEIESIEKERLFAAQEKYYRKIALTILSKLEGFGDVVEDKSGFKGVPFDLMTLSGDELRLVELKGSKKYFNKPDNVQLARLQQIIKDFKYDNFKLKAYLLQINLRKSTYRFDIIKFTKQIDPTLGKKTPTDNILKFLYAFINTKSKKPRSITTL